MSSNAMKYLSAIIAEGSMLAFVQAGQIDHLFSFSEFDKAAYECVRKHVKKYGKLPTVETVEKHADGVVMPQAPEAAAYYLDQAVATYTHRTMMQSMEKASALLKDKQAIEAHALMLDATMKLVATNHQQQVFDFRTARDLVIGNYKVKKAGDDYGLRLGWPTFDEMNGGLAKGDVLSLAGRPAQGKTWQLLYAAMHGWMEQGTKPPGEFPQSRLFVSMEMNIDAVFDRMAAMVAHIPFGHLKKAALSTTNYIKLKDGLTLVKGFTSNFWVIDGNLAATVDDIYALAKQLSPGAIFIDGGYLLKHPTEKDRYRRVAENSDLIKSMLAPLAPTAVSWQFAKTASKKKKEKDGKVGLEDIGYTDAIAQNSSIVLGMQEEENVETLNRRRIDILKGRNGESGHFYTAWDFAKMDFSEQVEEEVSELNFV